MLCRAGGKKRGREGERESDGETDMISRYRHVILNFEFAWPRGGGQDGQKDQCFGFNSPLMLQTFGNNMKSGWPMSITELKKICGL